MSLCRPKPFDLVVRVRRVADEPIGVPLCAQETAGLAGRADIVVEPHDVRHPHARQRRHALAGLEHLDDRAEIRPIAGLDFPRAAGRVLFAGQHPIAAGVVRVVVGRHRADHGQLVCHAGHAGEQLAKLDARHVGGDGLERSANFDRRVGLGVESLVLRRAPLQPKINNILGAAESRIARRPQPAAGLGRQQRRQRQPQQVQPANAQPLTAADAVAEGIGPIEDREHEPPLARVDCVAVSIPAPRGQSHRAGQLVQRPLAPVNRAGRWAKVLAERPLALSRGLAGKRAELDPRARADFT